VAERFGHSVILISLCCMLVSLFGAFVAFDMVVYALHKTHPGEWETLGRPRGFFWSPSERLQSVGQVIDSSASRFGLCLDWLFSTPDYLRHNPTAVTAVRWYRALMWVYLLSFASLFVL